MELRTFCECPFKKMRVTSDGNISMCRHMESFGNVLLNTLDEVWFDDIAEEVRIDTAAGRLHPRCGRNGCPHFRDRTDQNIIYNEYPTHIEIEVGGDSHRITLAKCLTRIAHVVPNLQHIHIQAESPFESKSAFEVLNFLKYDDYKNQITVSIITDMGMDWDMLEMWLDRVPHSVTTFAIDYSDDKSISLAESYYKKRTEMRQFIRLSFLIGVHNVHEAELMVKWAHNNVHADCIEFKTVPDEVTEDNCGLFARAQWDIESQCKRLHQSYELAEDLHLGFMDKYLI